MSCHPATDGNPITASGVRAVPCHDPYAEWTCEQQTDSDRLVAARLFWRRVPLQKDAVQAVVRATAAGVLPWLDKWHLAPVRPWLSAARSLAGAGLLPIPEDYQPPAHLCEFRRLLPNHRFQIRVGIGAEANATAQDTSAVERMLQWACNLLEADAVLFSP